MTGSPPSHPQRRAYFRVVYPSDYRPVLFIKGCQYPVLDISEAGVRFLNRQHTPLPEDVFSACVQFQDGEQIQIVGKVIRVQENQVALMLLIRGIPYRKVIAEQIFLRRQGYS